MLFKEELIVKASLLLPRVCTAGLTGGVVVVVEGELDVEA